MTKKNKWIIAGGTITTGAALGITLPLCLKGKNHKETSQKLDSPIQTQDLARLNIQNKKDEEAWKPNPPVISYPVSKPELEYVYTSPAFRLYEDPTPAVVEDKFIPDMSAVMAQLAQLDNQWADQSVWEAFNDDQFTHAVTGK